MKKSKSYPAINIQWPISQLIIDGKKTVETRTYPIPEKYINRELLIVETPGRHGRFKARIIGLVTFSRCYQYESKTSFYKDVKKHCVDPKSDWAWTGTSPKWGWDIQKLVKLNKPIPAPSHRGILFTKAIQLDL